MNPKKNVFPQQTHFIGVLLPDNLTSMVEECRRYMNRTYGCRSGHATPVHVTLVPPFALPRDYTTADVVEELLRGVPQDSGFSARTENFDAFGDRTLFAAVRPAPEWNRLKNAAETALRGAFPGCLRKDPRPFHPHITVANRDIPPGASTAALRVLSGKKFEEDFPVDNMTVFVRKGGGWEAAQAIRLDPP